MNHINWVQQDPDFQTEYHVLKWESSHFHEPLARRTVNSALHKEGAAFAMSADLAKSTDAEMGFGQSSPVKSGGFALGCGQAGVALQESAGAQKGQDSVSISVQGAERQEVGLTSENVGHPGIYNAVWSAAEAKEKVSDQEAQEQERQKENTVSAAIGQGSIRNRLKESKAHLQEAYQKQKEKIEKSLFRTKRAEKKADLPKKGTRVADKEDTLSMQAQNHYLLDSYDRNGQYRMLGK